jgi:hypothetical protein
MGQRMAASMADWGRDLEALARSLAPVDTGRLAASFELTVFVDGVAVYGSGSPSAGFRGQGVEVVLSNHAGYGRWVHDGTSDTAPQPFLQQALAAMLPRLPAALR